jgi:hypothetical protein
MPLPIPPLTEAFAGLTDWRAAQGKQYTLDKVLTLAFLAVLSGENGVRGIARWVKEQRWRLPQTITLKHHRVPGYETIRTVLRDVNITELEQGLQSWATQVAQAYQVEDWRGRAGWQDFTGQSHRRPSRCASLECLYARIGTGVGPTCSRGQNQ